MNAAPTGPTEPAIARTFNVGVDEAVHHLATLSRRLSNRDLMDSLLKELLGDDKPEDDIAIIVIEHE